MADLTVLPPGVIPMAVGLSMAAALVSVSKNHFEKLVASGIIRPPRVAEGRVLWLVAEIREDLSRLPLRNAPQGNLDSWADAT
jgi:hypothetical protein